MKPVFLNPAKPSASSLGKILYAHSDAGAQPQTTTLQFEKKIKKLKWRIQPPTWHIASMPHI